MSSAESVRRAVRKSQTFSNTAQSDMLLQRKCACGESGASSISGECEECRKKRLQRKLRIGASNDPLEREADRVADQVMSMSPNRGVNSSTLRIQRFNGQPSGEAGVAPASVDRVLSGSGKPLEPALQQHMGQRFGYDFSRVRVHTDSAAEQSAREVSAHAYTVGNNVVFGTGKYQPRTDTGLRLLAHELTHVVQQETEGTSNSIQREETKDCHATRRPPISGTATVPAATPSIGSIGEAYSRGFTGTKGATVNIAATASFISTGTSGDFSVTLRQCGHIFDSDVGSREVGHIGGRGISVPRTLPGAGVIMNTDYYYLRFRNSASRGDISVSYSIT